MGKITATRAPRAQGPVGYDLRVSTKSRDEIQAANRRPVKRKDFESLPMSANYRRAALGPEAGTDPEGQGPVRRLAPGLYRRSGVPQVEAVPLAELDRGISSMQLELLPPSAEAIAVA